MRIQQTASGWFPHRTGVVDRKVREPRLSPATHQMYEGYICNHIEPSLGSKRLKQLTATDICSLLTAKTLERKSPATVKQIHAILRSALQHATREDLVPRSVAKLVVVQAPPRKDVEPLTVEKARTLLAGIGVRLSGSTYVFTTGVGTPIEPRNVNRAFDALLRKAKLRRVRLHDLRHTCASLLLAEGVVPRVVMELLGHSTIAVTMNTYSHVIPALQDETAARMDAVFTADANSSVGPPNDTVDATR